MIDKRAPLWIAIDKTIISRVDSLKEKLCSPPVSHEPGKDDITRAKMFELLELQQQLNKLEL